MKQIILITAILLLFISGCSKDNPVTPIEEPYTPSVIYQNTVPFDTLTYSRIKVLMDSINIISPITLNKGSINLTVKFSSNINDNKRINIKAFNSGLVNPFLISFGTFNTHDSVKTINIFGPTNYIGKYLFQLSSDNNFNTFDYVYVEKIIVIR